MCKGMYKEKETADKKLNTNLTIAVLRKILMEEFWGQVKN